MRIWPFSTFHCNLATLNLGVIKCEGTENQIKSIKSKGQRSKLFLNFYLGGKIENWHILKFAIIQFFTLKKLNVGKKKTKFELFNFVLGHLPAKKAFSFILGIPNKTKQMGHGKLPKQN